MTAIICSFFPDRHFGFLRTDDNKDVFFHASNFKGRGVPKVGAHVTFEFGEPAKLGQRPQAMNVRPDVAQQLAEAGAQ